MITNLRTMLIWEIFQREIFREKKQANLKKHGIDFIDAQLLWNDPRLLEIPVKTEDELVIWLLVLLTTSIGLLLLPIEKQMLGLFLFVAHASRRLHSMKAKDFEKKFNENQNITDSLDSSKAKRVLQAQKRVNVDFPIWMIESLDREAGKLGVTRQVHY